MAFALTLSILTLIVLFIASYTDIKTREVPDWISYSFMFAAGLIRVLFSLELGWQIIVSGLVGFGITFLFALLFYVTGQWGGADSKLLMAMGIVLGADFIFIQDGWALPLYFITLLFVGAIFGLIWSTILAIIHHARFYVKLKERLHEYKKEHIVIALISLIFVIVGLVWMPITALVGLFPIVSFYLFKI